MSVVGLIDQPNNPMFIGLSGCADNAGYFDGLIDDVRTNNTILVVGKPMITL